MGDDFEKNLGQKIRLARQRAGLTQEDLAARVSRTPESISNIELGLQEPGIKIIQSLAKALGLPLSELLELSEAVSVAKNSPSNPNLSSNVFAHTPAHI
jgi:transcriptional regulator with XRE-family HTH domain